MWQVVGTGQAAVKWQQAGRQSQGGGEVTGGAATHRKPHSPQPESPSAREVPQAVCVSHLLDAQEGQTVD